MNSDNHFIRNKIIAFFSCQQVNKKRHLFITLCEELQMLFDQAEMTDGDNLHDILALAHKLKGICSYLMLHHEPIFQLINSKQALLFSISMLQNEIRVVESEL